MATWDNFILNVWESQEELNYITVKSRKMAGLESLLVAVTVLLCLTSSQNITTLNLALSGEQETSPTVMETPLETSETSVERLDDCEEDEWSCHQKGKMEISKRLKVGNFFLCQMCFYYGSITIDTITKSLKINRFKHFIASVWDCVGKVILLLQNIFLNIFWF